jgi:hypothetical protein
MAVRDVVQAAAGNSDVGVVAPVGIDFDGTNDYLSLSSTIARGSDYITHSFWMYYTGDAGYIFKKTGVEIEIYSSKIAVSIGDGRFTEYTYNVDSVRNTWVHVLIYSNLAVYPATNSIYINEELLTSLYDSANFNVTWGGDHEVGLGFKGRIAHFFQGFGARDYSIEANRRLFITEDKKPAEDLASLNPILYLPMDDASDPGRNDGTGGDFTLNGIVAQSGRGPNQDNCVASAFDGSNDYLSSTGIGASDGKVFTLSSVMEVTTVGYARFFAIGTTAGGMKLEARKEAGNLYLRAANTSGTQVLEVSTPALTMPLGSHIHIVISVDLSDTAKRAIYIDGVAITGTWSTYTDDTLDFTSDVYLVGAPPNIPSGYKWNGALGETYFNTAYTDLATDNPFWNSDTNRPNSVRKVIEDTGVTPLIALPMYANDAGNNLGTGGDFTVNSGPYVGARGGSEFWARSAAFNGSDQYLRRTTIAGAVDTLKTFTFVMAWKWGTAGSPYIFRTGSGEGVSGTPGPNIRFTLADPISTMDARVPVSSSTTEWQTIMFSVDLSDTGKRFAYVNGTAATVNWVSYPNIAYDSLLSVDNYGIGSSYAGGDYFDGNMGFLYMSQEYIDFSQEANRLKFFDAFNYPVDLGADGSTPTDTQPLIYMSNDIHLGTNLGSGGNFTPVNTPTAGPDVKG